MIKIEVGKLYTKEERSVIENKYPLQCNFRYAGFGLVELTNCNNRIHKIEIENNE
jgi:hypothetical protein